MKKTLLLTTVAAILLAPSAFALNDDISNTANGNSQAFQNTGSLANSGTINNGAGAGSTLSGGSATATVNPTISPTISPTIAPVNTLTASTVANGGLGGQGGRGGNGGVGVGVGGSQSQSATTGNQSINVEAAKRNAPPVYAPGLTSGIDTCLGSATGGLTTPLGGITGGGTTPDKDCVRIKMSRELDLRGYREAGVAMLCFNDEVRAAMATAGTPCADAPESATYEAQTVEGTGLGNGSRNR